MNANMRRSKTCCCVVGCTNSYYNTDSTVKFFSFPRRWFDEERRNVWVQRVRQTFRKKNELWQPKIHNKICSAHFIGNDKSNNPLHPSYHPTIFPSENKNKTARGFKRSVERVASTSTAARGFEEIQLTNVMLQDFSCQVNLEKSEKCVGNSESVNCAGFHGFTSSKEVCGVTFENFLFLLQHLKATHKSCKLSTENQLLLFLMKMKLGLSFSYLSVLFNIHYSSCSRIFVKVLKELCQKLASVVSWPSRNAVNTLPESFKLLYPNCLAIIDCTEVKIERIDDGASTGKFLIGVAPSGFVSFVSKCYDGRSSDSSITNDCGILNLLEPGDTVLTDKGFSGIKCNDDVRFVHEGILAHDTYNISSVRIHVERSIQRIKLYNILSKIPVTLLPHLDQIVLMCCILTNLQPPIIKGSHN